MQNETLFAENFAQLLRFCPGADKDILEADLHPLQHCKTSSGEDNLLVEVDGVKTSLYNSKGALLEAQEWLEEVYPIHLQILFVYGVGLGTYFDVLEEWLHSNPRRTLIILEDNPGIIAAFLHTERAKKILNHSQVIFYYFPFPSEHGWGIFRKQFMWICDACTCSPWAFFALKMYRDKRSKAVELIDNQFAMLIRDAKTRFVDNFELFDKVNINFYNNFYKLPESSFIQTLYNKFIDIPFLLCGAGPSLNNEFERIKTLENKAVILGSATGFNILTRNGVIPHFGYGLDPYEIQESRQLTHFGFETPFFYQNRFFYNALSKIHGPRIYTGSVTFRERVEWFNAQLELPPFINVDRGISTSTAFANIAQSLGANPLILLGVDLAYSNSKRYAGEPSRHVTDADEHKKHDLFVSNERLQVSSTLGNSVDTNWGWIVEGSYFTELAREFPKQTLINASEGGLQIYEIDYLPLQVVVDKYMQHSYDIQNWIHAELQQEKALQLTEEKVLKVCEEWIKLNETALKDLSEIIEEVDQIKGQTFSDEDFINKIQEGKLGLLRKNFLKNPFYTHFLRMYDGWYDSLAAFELSKLHFFPHHYSPEEKAQILLNAAHGRHVLLKNYAERNKSIAEDALTNFNKRRALLTEMQAKTVQVTDVPELHADQIYRFEKGLLTLNDAEHDLSYEGPFKPQVISAERIQAHRGNTKLLTTTEGVYEGQALLLYPGGEIKGEMYYLNSKLHGPTSFYTPQGVLLARSWFLEDMRVGKSWQYTAEGKLYSLQRYRNGLRDGLQEYYYPSGVLKTRIPYKEGAIDGEVLLNYPNGSPLRKLQFVKGKLQGKEWIWNEHDLLILEAEYANNLPFGRTQQWHYNGKLAKELFFHGGDASNYDMRLWNEEGQLLQTYKAVAENPMKEFLEKSQELKASIAALTAQVEKIKEQTS